MFQRQFNLIGKYSVIFVMSFFAISGSVWAVQAQTAVPTISITEVDRNNTVTISGKNFPTNQTFNVRMGHFGTLGIGGAESTTTVNSGNGAFTAKLAIPAAVHNYSRIAVRLENGSAYNSYNWFWNNSTATAVQTTDDKKVVVSGKPAYSGIPTIEFIKVEGEQVTFKTNNFPPNQLFRVTMGSRASGGYSDFVTTFNSGDGANKEMSVTIPPRIAHYGYIWLRTQTTHVNPYSAYVGFNNPAAVSNVQAKVDPPAGKPPVAKLPVWHGTPTIKICGVAAGNEITFVTNNLTTNLDYTVRMNAFGTMGHNGSVVGTLSPGDDPSVRATFKIPAAFAGHGRIAIRLDAPGGYNAYNWFWNSNAAVC